MGLDMYLERQTYVQRWEHIPAEKQFTVTVTQGGNPYPAIKPERVKYVTEQVAYWRKANAIHDWFVRNVQGGKDDCRTYDVPIEKLTELVGVAKQVLAANLANAAETLPTAAGFFFGSTDYDDDYRMDLEDTVKQLEAVLAEDNSGAVDFFYRASW